jgi:uncharacterized membrane protein
MTLKDKPKMHKTLLAILVLQLTVSFTVMFNVPIARQVLSFIYFTFIPGFIVVKLFKLNLKLNQLETVIFSVGFSIAFLMITGLLINEFSLLAGYSQPLSIIPLMMVLNFLPLIGTIILFFKDNLKESNVMCSDGSVAKLLPFIYFPIVSVVGAIYANIYRSNFLLLFMIILIATLFIAFVILTNSKVQFPTLYPFAIFIIAITLLYHSSFTSSYLIGFGSDVAGEYFTFKITEFHAHWSSDNPYIGTGWSSFGRLNAMLSITILPAFYSVMLNVDSLWIFKILFPLIFSLVPLSLYELWRAYIGNKYAFISAFLFIAEATFYTEMLGLNRQMIAELFFVLLFLVTVNDKLKRNDKILCFIIFGFSLVTSHYGLAEIFLFFISLMLISLRALKRSTRKITVAMVLFFFVIMFSWYIYTSRSAVFESFVDFGNHIYSQLGDFFNIESRGEAVIKGLGLEAPPTILNMLSRLFAYLTEAFIVVGFLGLITRRVKIRFDKEFYALTIIAMAFLGLLILVPGLAKTMSMTRFYHVLLFFLSPLCVVGAETLVSIVSKRSLEKKVSILLLIVLIPYFLFQSGFVYEITGNDNWSVPLSGYRMDALRLHGFLGYSTVYSVAGAQWLHENIEIKNNARVYADYWGGVTELRSYGLIYLGYVETLSNVTKVKNNEVLYLSSLNVIHVSVVGENMVWNTNDFYFIHDLNKIYSNGGSQIYRGTP